MMPNRWLAQAVLVLLVAAAVAGVSTAPAAPPAPAPPAEAPDEQPEQEADEPPEADTPMDAVAVDAATASLAARLLKAGRDGQWSALDSRHEPGSLPALCLWVLAQEARGDADRTLLNSTAAAMTTATPETVVARALRLLALCQMQPRPRIETLTADVVWLMRAQDASGGWGFGPGHPAAAQNPGWTDTRRTHLATRALSAAADSAVAVPPELLQRTLGWWIAAQNPDGGWGFQGPAGERLRVRGASHGSATAAGVDALAELSRHVRLSAAGLKALASGRDWLLANARFKAHPHADWGPDPLDHARWLRNAALTAGRIGLPPPAAAEAASALVQQAQGPDPSLAAGAQIEHAALTLQALRRLDAPVAFGVIGPTGPDALPLVGLTCGLRSPYAGAGWTALSTRAPLEALRRHPVVVLDVRTRGLRPRQAGGLLQRLIDATTHGGLAVVLMPQDPEASQLLQRRITGIGRQRGLTARPLQAGDPLLAATAPLGEADVPGATTLTDGVRIHLLMMHDDITRGWLSAADSRGRDVLFMQNVLACATDLAPAGRRFAPAPVEAAADAGGATERSIRVLRLGGAGDWAGAGEALKALHGDLVRSLSVGVEVANAPAEGPLEGDVLWLCATADLRIGPAQAARIKAFVEAGGLLVAEAANGEAEAVAALSAALKAVAPAAALEPLPADHPLLTGTFGGGLGADATQVQYSRAARAHAPQLTRPVLKALRVGGRIGAVVSPYGLSAGIVGRPILNSRHVVGDDGRRLGVNLLLYAVCR